jgi:serine protease AprX
MKLEGQMRPIHKLIQIITIFLLLGMIIGPAATPVQANAMHAQAELIQIAVQQPEQQVSVIVQKVEKGSAAEEMAERLGGTVTQDLSIINAFAAKMTASAALELSQSVGIRWVSLNAKMESSTCSMCIDTANLTNAYVRSIRADQVWNNTPYLQGVGIGVAVVDSGINSNGDLYTVMGVNRQVADVSYNTDYNQNPSDGYGHGTVVSSIIGGDGSDSGGKYIGVAPLVNIINVKVSNDDGSATETNVIQGLQWVLDHKDKYNIRVVNLSLNTTSAESYHNSPLDAAVEILWFNKIVVVVSAGNQGNGAIFPPANDPFVITVGATDDKGSSSISDDTLASFSAYGVTSDGFQKPDLVAPGKNIVGRMVNTNMGMGQAHPSNVISGTYFKMSGTSVSAPIVSGAVALLLQKDPSLTPDQVKFRLQATANKSWPGYNASKVGAGYLDIYKAVNGTSKDNANTNINASQLLWTGSKPVSWNSVSWNSVSWNSVSWNSVSWNSVSWNSVSWNSDYWEK